MKIGFVGSHGTGKTTLLKEIESRNLFPDHKIVYSRRLDLAYGLDISQDGYKGFGFDLGVEASDSINLFSLMFHAYALKHHEDMISDRCLLDVLAYTKSEYNKGLIQEGTLDFMEKLVFRDVQQYDYLFYLEPEFELEDNGIRPVMDGFQEEINTIVKEYLYRSRYTFSNLIQITGSVEERLQQIINHTK